MEDSSHPTVASKACAPPAEPRQSKVRKVLRILLIVLVILPVLVLIGLWSALAIHFSNLPSQGFRTALAWVFVLGFGTAFAFINNRRRTALYLMAAFGIVLALWLMKLPSHDRDWDPFVAVLPSATIAGDLVTVRNIRNFEYRTAEDFTPRYYDKTFDLREIRTVDFIMAYWGPGEAITHTMLSFGFNGGEYLTVSVEIRPERGEPYTALGGLFKKYELIHILGDERDLIRLRTNFRNERVYLYPTRSPPEDVRTLFLDIIGRINEIAANPEFYNTLAQNCFTSLAPSIRKIRPPRPFDIRLLLNGYIDRMGYENGWIDSDDSFEVTRKRHHINQYVEGKPYAPNFSQLIRPHLANR